MNEQIRLLSEQAHRSTTNELAHLQRVHNRTYDLNESAAIYNEKFAELIVRDCMDVVDGYTKQRTFDTHYDAVEQIEALFGIKHFGVEE
jgi:hypothetical protein